MFVLVIIFVVTFFVLLRKEFTQNYSRLPNGPFALPIIGNAHQLVGSPHKTLSHWANKFGSVYKIKLGMKTAVIVNNTFAMKRIFGNLVTTGRFNLPAEITVQGKFGLPLAEGAEWLELRQLFVKAMQKYSLGDNGKVERVILDESRSFLLWLQSSPGQVARKIDQHFALCMSRIFWKLTATSNDTFMAECLGSLSTEWFGHMQKRTIQLLMLFPSLLPIASAFPQYRSFMKTCANLQTIVKTYYNKRLKEHVEGNSQEDLYNAFFKKLKACKNQSSPLFGKKAALHGYASFLGLYLASSHTVAIVLGHAINYLSAYPEVQRTLQKEIDQIYGKAGQPNLRDIKRVPYTESFLLETLRYSSIGPLGLAHACLEDFEFEQYRIPKGTILLANIYYANHDKSIWGDPQNFRPERFMSANYMKKFIASFQPGLRVCIGENLAKQVLFMMIVMLIQHFDFKKIPGKTVADYVEPLPGFNMTPPDQGVIVSRRK